MKIGESYVAKYPEDKLNGIPFDLIKVMDGVYTFYKKRGDTEVRMDITEDQFHLYGITNESRT